MVQLAVFCSRRVSSKTALSRVYGELIEVKMLFQLPKQI